MTSGFRGSPAPATSRRAIGFFFRSSRTSMRHTVGGAQSVVTRCAERRARVLAASNRAAPDTKMHAPAFQGAKNELHACFAQPGELMLQCRSSSRIPIQYIVDR